MSSVATSESWTINFVTRSVFFSPFPWLISIWRSRAVFFLGHQMSPENPDFRPQTQPDYPKKPDEVHIGSLCCITSLKPPKSLIILLCESHSMESQYDSNSRNQVAAGASDFADELHKQLSQRHKPSCLGLSVGILSEMVLATERIGFRRKNIR